MQARAILLRMPNITRNSKSQPARLRESYRGYGFDSIDREHGIIRGVRILGLKSRNGRTYLREAVVAAIPLYEGARVYLNHQDKGERRIQERWGKLENVREADDGSGLIADLRYLKEHVCTAQILEAAETFRDIGLSHDSLGRSRPGANGERVVYEIVEVKSVDLVEKPATTQHLWESKTVKLKVLDVLREHRGAFPVADQFLTRFAEMSDEIPDEMAGIDGAEMEMPEGTPEDDQVKAALRQAVIAVLDGPDGSAETINKIRMLLSTGDKIGAGTGAGAAGEMPEGEGEDGSDEKDEEMKKLLPQMSESLKAIESRLRLLESQQTTKDLEALLESKNRAVTPDRVRLLSKTPESEREALVESWSPLGSRPPVSAPRYAQSSGAAGAGSYAAVRQQLRVHAKK